jgi:hypothetical protein
MSREGQGVSPPITRGWDRLDRADGRAQITHLTVYRIDYLPL